MRVRDSGLICFSDPHIVSWTFCQHILMTYSHFSPPHKNNFLKDKKMEGINKTSFSETLQVSSEVNHQHYTTPGGRNTGLVANTFPFVFHSRLIKG